MNSFRFYGHKHIRKKKKLYVDKVSEKKLYNQKEKKNTHTHTHYLELWIFRQLCLHQIKKKKKNGYTVRGLSPVHELISIE